MVVLTRSRVPIFALSAFPEISVSLAQDFVIICSRSGLSLDKNGRGSCETLSRVLGQGPEHAGYKVRTYLPQDLRRGQPCGSRPRHIAHQNSSRTVYFRTYNTSHCAHRQCTICGILSGQASNFADTHLTLLIHQLYLCML